MATKDDSDQFELDSELEDDLTLDNIENSELDDVGKPVAGATAMYHLISDYGSEVTDLLLKKFAESNVQMKHLSSLTDADLESMGIKQPSIRKSLLDDFAVIPNQAQHYDKILTTTDANKYNNDVLNNISAHLANIKTSISIALLETKLKPIENHLVDDTTYASTLVLKIFDEVERYSYGIEEQLQQLEKLNLSPDSTVDRPAKLSRQKMKIVGTLVALSVGSILAYRTIKSAHFSGFNKLFQ